MAVIFGLPVETFNAGVNAVTAISAAAAAIFAFRGLRTWKLEMVGRRKAELAENLISGFYEARDIFMSARHPGSFSSEVKGLKVPGHSEDPFLSPLALGELTVHYLPLARIERSRPTLAQLHAMRYRARVLFTHEIDDAFQKLREVEGSLQSSFSYLARRIVAASKAGTQVNQNEAYQERADRLSYTGEENDAIKRDLDAAVQIVEELCSPAISRAVGR